MSKTSGIYAIVNRVNRKRYVGSTVSFRRRKYDHWRELRKGIHSNKHLQASWNKHGEDCFEFVIVERVSADFLLDAEQKHLDANLDGYNIAKHAQASLRGVTFTDAHKAKIAAALKGKRKAKLSAEHKAKLSSALTGRIFSAEHKAKISVAAKNRKAWKHSVEAKAKISAASKGRKLSVEHKAKIGAAQKGVCPSPVCLAAAAMVHKGRKLSIEHKAKISSALSKRKLSAEHKTKMSVARKGKTWTVARRLAYEQTVKTRVA